MSLPTLFLVALGLSMDAFAAAIVAGVALGRPTFLDGLKISAPFGAFALSFPCWDGVSGPISARS